MSQENTDIRHRALLHTDPEYCRKYCEKIVHKTVDSLCQEESFDMFTTYFRASNQLLEPELIELKQNLTKYIDENFPTEESIIKLSESYLDIMDIKTEGFTSSRMVTRMLANNE